LVFRPADGVETAECWELALDERHAPSLLALTRQGLPTVRRGTQSENLTARGAYVLAESDGPRQVTLLATGSEIEIALAARETLSAKGVAAAVVSMPCWTLFDRQDEAYRAQVLGSAPRVAVEAASSFGWERYLGSGGAMVGMPGFGASAPAEQLYPHFGITAEKVVGAALRLRDRKT